MSITGPFAIDELVRVSARRREPLSLPDVGYRVLEIFIAPPRASTFGPADALVVETGRGPLVLSPEDAIRVAAPPGPVEAPERAELSIGPGYVVTKLGGPITFAVVVQHKGKPFGVLPEPTRSAMKGLTDVLTKNRAAAHAVSHAIQAWIDDEKRTPSIDPTTLSSMIEDAFAKGALTEASYAAAGSAEEGMDDSHAFEDTHIDIGLKRAR